MTQDESCCTTPQQIQNFPFVKDLVLDWHSYAISGLLKCRCGGVFLFQLGFDPSQEPERLTGEKRYKLIPLAFIEVQKLFKLLGKEVNDWNSTPPANWTEENADRVRDYVTQLTQDSKELFEVSADDILNSIKRI